MRRKFGHKFIFILVLVSVPVLLGVWYFVISPGRNVAEEVVRDLTAQVPSKPKEPDYSNAKSSAEEVAEINYDNIIKITCHFYALDTIFGERPGFDVDVTNFKQDILNYLANSQYYMDHTLGIDSGYMEFVKSDGTIIQFGFFGDGFHLMHTQMYIKCFDEFVNPNLSYFVCGVSFPKYYIRAFTKEELLSILLKCIYGPLDPWVFYYLKVYGSEETIISLPDSDEFMNNSDFRTLIGQTEWSNENVSIILKIFEGNTSHHFLAEVAATKLTNGNYYFPNPELMPLCLPGCKNCFNVFDETGKKLYIAGPHGDGPEITTPLSMNKPAVWTFDLDINFPEMAKAGTYYVEFWNSVAKLDRVKIVRKSDLPVKK